jgi:subtilisin family serine protease
MKTPQVFGLMAVAALITCGQAPSESESSLATTQKFLRTENAVAGQYIVVLNRAAPEVAARETSSLVAELAAASGARVFQTYRVALTGFAARMDEAAARQLATDPRVAYVAEDGVAKADAIQPNPPWGLDRIDQRNLPLNAAYRYDRVASNVHVYVLDTGIRPTHVDFGGRASADADFVGDGHGPVDCNGHGTHVAGTIGGTTYGVAKSARLHGIRVLGCSGSGSWSGVIAGVDYVTANHVKPAVANMSLSGGEFPAVEQAVSNSIAAGVVYTVAASNNFGTDACAFSPAGVTEALTVAASDINDNRATFTNIGCCVDLYAPGVNVVSAWYSSDTSINTLNGTSMAAPHVAGAVALFLERAVNVTPARVAQVIVESATPNVIVDPGANTPNRLLYAANPIDDATTFVQQGYRDLLRREPDAGGLAYYVNKITSCGSNESCIASRRAWFIGDAMGSAEYRGLHPELVSGSPSYYGVYVLLHYLDLWRRPADPPGFANYVNLLAPGTVSKLYVNDQFITLPEYRQRFGIP